MSVYVDDARLPYRRMLMCHMVADTLAELHQMAHRIGIQRKWFQSKTRYPHYDICLSKRELALSFGALACDKYKLIECAKKLRAESLTPPEDANHDKT